MTDRELMQQALEALTAYDGTNGAGQRKRVLAALRERLAQPEQEQWDAIPDAFNEWWDADYDDTGNPYRKDSPAYWAWSGWKAASKQPDQEFIKHHGDNEGWSDWVCPDPDDYLIKCCDCGLVHEAEFGVVRYKSDTDREDCDMVNDPNLQAVFRMRRSEQWSPADMAHRAGSLTMEQPAQQEPVTWRNAAIRVGEDLCSVGPFRYYDMTAEQWLDWALSVVTVHAPPTQRKPLTDEEIKAIWKPVQANDFHDCVLLFARAIEAKLKEKNNG